MQLEGNVFLVTGGSSGLGRACTEMLVRAGARVTAVDINAINATAAPADAGIGSPVRFVAADVSDEKEIQQAITTAQTAFGRLNGAINCAGICPPERILGKTGPQPLASFSRTINVNLIGTFNVLRLSAAAIAQADPDPEGERGVIINTASIAAFDGQIGQASYAASKGAVASMTLPAARELARFGIRVVAIAPGIFDTPMIAGLPDEARASLGRQTQFPARLGRPKEFAELVRHVIENRMLNGTVIRLDGALRMAAK